MATHRFPCILLDMIQLTEVLVAVIVALCQSVTAICNWHTGRALDAEARHAGHVAALTAHLTAKLVHTTHTVGPPVTQFLHRYAQSSPHTAAHSAPEVIQRTLIRTGSFI